MDVLIIYENIFTHRDSKLLNTNKDAEPKPTDDSKLKISDSNEQVELSDNSVQLKLDDTCEQVLKVPYSDEECREAAVINKLITDGVPFTYSSGGIKVFSPKILQQANGHYQCPICSFTKCRSKSSFRAHMDRHSGKSYVVEINDSSFSCDYCGSQLDSSHTYSWHCGCKETPFQRFCLLKAYRSHIQTYHKNIELDHEQLAYKCPFCDWTEIGSNAGVLSGHLNNHGNLCLVCEKSRADNHVYSQMYHPSSERLCIVCSYKTTTVFEVKRDLVGRLRVPGSFVPQGVVIISTETEVEISQNGEVTVTYSVNPETLMMNDMESSDESLDKGLDETAQFFRIKDEEKRYQCYYCVFTSPLATHMNDHIAKCHVQLKSYTCKICPSFKASRSATWLTHMLSAHNVCTHLIDHPPDAQQMIVLARIGKAAMCSECAAKRNCPTKKRLRPLMPKLDVKRPKQDEQQRAS